MKQTLIGRVQVVWLLSTICKQIGTKLLIADLYGHYGDDMVSIKIVQILELIEWHSMEKIQTQRFWQRFNALWTQKQISIWQTKLLQNLEMCYEHLVFHGLMHPSL